MIETLLETETRVFVRIHGKYFWSRQHSPDAAVCDCMNCHCLIGEANIPWRLFFDGGRQGELTFCRQCLKELNLLDMKVIG